MVSRFNYGQVVPMLLAFETPRLRDICEDPGSTLPGCPEAVLRTLEAALADLAAADRLSDVLALLGVADALQAPPYVIRLGEGWSMRFVPNHGEPSPAPTVTNRVRIMFVGMEREP